MFWRLSDLHNFGNQPVVYIVVIPAGGPVSADIQYLHFPVPGIENRTGRAAGFAVEVTNQHRGVVEHRPVAVDIIPGGRLAVVQAPAVIRFVHDLVV